MNYFTWYQPLKVAYIPNSQQLSYSLVIVLLHVFIVLCIYQTGQTFQPNNETFLPRVSFDTTRLVFPAVNAKESTYRTLMLTNNGTTPILFDIQKDPTK